MHSNTTKNTNCYSLMGFCNPWIYYWLDNIVTELNNVYCLTAWLYCTFQQQFKILLECIEHLYNTIKREHSFSNKSSFQKQWILSSHSVCCIIHFVCNLTLDHKLLLYLIKGDLAPQKVKGLILWSIILRYEFNGKIEEEKQPRNW